MILHFFLQVRISKFSEKRYSTSSWFQFSGMAVGRSGLRDENFEVIEYFFLNFMKNDFQIQCVCCSRDCFDVYFMKKSYNGFWSVAMEHRHRVKLFHQQKYFSILGMRKLSKISMCTQELILEVLIDISPVSFN